MTSDNQSVSASANGVRMMLGVNVPMRDGVELNTDVYLPDLGSPVPILLMRTPYSKNQEAIVLDCIYYATRGYGVVMQNTRGRWDSGGDWYPFIHEINDGFDTQQWIGQQAWCDGSIGTMGASYLAMTQWQAAQRRSPYLKAMVPRVGSSNFHGSAYCNGAMQLGFAARWAAIQMQTRTNQAMYPWLPEEYRITNILKHLPLVTLDEAAGRVSSAWKDWISHPNYDAYWRDMSPVTDHFDQIETPAYGIAGWYDMFLRTAIENFVGVGEKGRNPGKDRQKLLIGPWGHDLSSMGQDTAFGDIEFGDAAKMDLRHEHLRWFDYWLKGKENGIIEEPSVRVFVMGTNRWRTADSWPIPGTQFTPYYFHSQGLANTVSGDGTLSLDGPNSEQLDQFVYDPEDPVPTTGGPTFAIFPDPTSMASGPRDQREIEQRSDVLVYTSARLAREVEVTGPIKIVLYAASTAEDTDFTAKLVDVHPDGSSINVAQGIVRGRYRDSLEDPTLMVPGNIYRLEIDLWATSNCFQKDHRIRVDISSSNFPHFDRNLNTGGTFGQESETRIARQSIYHDEERPSHIILPVIVEVS